MKIKDEIIEVLDFEESKPKVGRPKLANRNDKKKSLIIAGGSFAIVIMLLVFGYGTLFGFKGLDLSATAIGNKSTEEIIISDISPIIDKITLRVGTARKVYLTVLPAGATNKIINYASSDETVATVDSKGRVSAISEGTATVTATTTDGSNKSAEFEINVIKDASGNCKISTLNKNNSGINYEIECDNAKVKEVQYKVDKGDYKKISSKKSIGVVELSKKELNKNITLKVVYNANNSSISKYVTKTLNNVAATTKKVNGSCSLSLNNVNSNSAKYDITCDNASVSNIAYKIGTGSYVGIDNSSLADTIIYEESNVTRVLYFKIDYLIDDSDEVKTISKSSIIEKGVANGGVE